MWNEQQSKRVGPFEVKGKTVQYQEKFLLQLMQSLALDKRGTCTCTGRVTAQGNKDTMTTMVVVIRGGRAKLHKIKRDGGQIAQPRYDRSQTLICGE